MSGRNPSEKKDFFAGCACAAIRAAVIRGVLPSRAKPAGQGLGVCCPAAGIAAGQAVLRGWVGAAGWGACCAPGGWGMVSAGRFAAGTGQSAGVSGFLNFFVNWEMLIY